MADTRSILDLGIEELELVLATNSLPDGVGLSGLEHRPDADKLYKHRFSPKFIAQALLKDLLKTRVLSEPSSSKSERLALQKAELELKQKKVAGQSQMQNLILDKLRNIEATQRIIMAQLSQLTGGGDR